MLKQFPDAHADDSGEDLLFENPNHQRDIESDEDDGSESGDSEGDGEEDEPSALGLEQHTKGPPDSDNE